MKNFWSVIILLGLLIGLGLYFSSHSPAGDVADDVIPSKGIITSSSTKSYIENKENRYTAHIETPTVYGHANAEAFNALAKVYVDRATEEFAMNAAEANFNIPDIFKDQSHGLSATVQTTIVADRYVSVLFTREYDMLAAAHPFHLIESLVYDLEAKKVIELSDVFENAPKALDYISSRSAEQVKAHLAASDAEESFNVEGVMPEEANFRIYIIGQSGITFHFIEYQVAPYAAGPQKALLTWAELRPLLTPAFKALTQ